MFNENKFRGKIAETRLTLASVASSIGINPATLNRKMSGESDFTRSEMQNLRAVLNLTPEEFEAIFFAV